MGLAFNLNILESPLPKNALYQVWLNQSSGSGGEDENVKSLHTMDERQPIRLELSAQVN